MSAPISGGKVNADLDRAMSEMLKEVKAGKDKNGRELSFLDRLRILDRVLKWEAIKVHMKDDTWGAKFQEGGD